MFVGELEELFNKLLLIAGLVSLYMQVTCVGWDLFAFVAFCNCNNTNFSSENTCSCAAIDS